MPMIEALNQVDPLEDAEPAASTSAQQDSWQSKSSSSSCTLKTASNCTIACTVTAVTTVGDIKRRKEGEACSTVCRAPITSCDATGVTTTSTVTTTSAIVPRCSPGCAECNRSSRLPMPESIDLSGYSTATNGVLFLPAQTIAELPLDTSVATRSITARESSSSSRDLVKRQLTSPYDDAFRGRPNGVSNWLRLQIALSRDQVMHGQGVTTGFSFPLLALDDTWSLVDLYGCTSVIRKRIAMTHIWESPSMLTPDQLYPHILDPLLNGPMHNGPVRPRWNGNNDIPQGLTPFTAAGGDFENIPENKVRAFVITSYRREAKDPSNGDIEFPSEIGKIKNLLSDVLGRDDTLLIPYIPGKHSDPDNTNPWGKVLIQYDPQQALLQQSDGNCNTQIAQLEICVSQSDSTCKSSPSNPLPPNPPPANPGPTAPARMASVNNEVKRLLRGREVTEKDENEWEQYENMMRRQNNGGICFIPSTSLPSSTGSRSLLTNTNSTTFQTSTIPVPSAGDTMLPLVISLSTENLPSQSSSDTASSIATIPSNSSADIISSTDIPPPQTSIDGVSDTETPSTIPTSEPPSSTDIPPPESSTPAPLPPPPPKTKALSVILRQETTNDEYSDSWTFFQTDIGKQADACAVPLFEDKGRIWHDFEASNEPLGPKARTP
ncbi:hypothetical protein BDV96DRAFT_594777 [Lophiotrema nucula]|uniref:Uncharacterized protein n=1 Tax=Lophiotrema nucula TaxID=690887 RepID=A0A6A5ZRW1_9PLEO|nr:hypothetical protein BDV96DRAFT_594777 [Lophiotrema nucula]